MQQVEIIEKITYFCDCCNKDITGVEHICIEDASRFGLVCPPDWQFQKTRSHRRTYQFCNIRCLSKFVRKEGKKYEKRN